MSPRPRRTLRVSAVTYDPGAVRRRRTVLGGSLVVATLLAAVLLKCVLTLGGTAQGERSRDAGDPEAAARWFALAHHVNVAERWIAPYNSGVAAYDLAQWKRAAEFFAQAQTSAPAHVLCRVVINRVLALESQGDALTAADDVQGAQVTFREAQEVLADAEGCSADTQDAGGESEGEQDADHGSSTPQDAGSDPDADEQGETGENGEAGDPGQGEGPGEGQAPGEGAAEGKGAGKGDGSGDGSTPGEGGGSAAGTGGRGPMSEQEQVDAANARLAQKVGARPADGKGEPAPGPSPQQADELAERNAEGARKAQSEQDGAGSGGEREPGRTW